MKKEATFLASADIARRAGVTETNYRLKDGRYVISEKCLRSFRMSMTPEEYAHGLDVEIVSDEEALRLIKESGYTIGEPKEQQPATDVAETASPGGADEEDIADTDTDTNTNEEEE